MQHHSIEHGGFSDVNDNVPDDPDLGGGRQSLDRLALRKQTGTLQRTLQLFMLTVHLILRSVFF